MGMLLQHYEPTTLARIDKNEVLRVLLQRTRNA